MVLDGGGRRYIDEVSAVFKGDGAFPLSKQSTT